MAQEETILLHFDIDEQPAVNSIKDLRTANSQLRAERDKVNISTKEGRELVDKLNVAIDKNNKVIKDNSSALEKQRQNVGNYSKSIQEAAGNLNIMGTNVGALGTKLASFVNPLTATVAIVGALGAAYARSSVGAKDLEFASNQLSFAVDSLTDSFARNFSSVEDGEGGVTKLFNSYLKFNENMPTGKFLKLLGIDLKEIREQSFNAAQAMEALQQVQRDAALAQAAINERNAETADLMAEVANTENEINLRLAAGQKIRENIKQNAEELETLKNREILAELQILKVRQDSGGNIEDIEFRINKLVAERAAIGTAEERQNTKIEKQLNAINNAEKKRLDLIDEQNTKKRLSEVKQPGVSVGTITAEGSLSGAANQEIKLSNETTGVVLQNNEVKRESWEDYVDRIVTLQDIQAGAARNLAGTLADIADEGTAAQKALALTTIAINSGIGVSEAVKAGAGIPWPANLSAILSGITAVLAGIAQAKSLLGFAEGGWTGPGNKYKAVGVVHADEYVTPKHIVHSPAAQPHIAALERMRTGYYDGGFVTNSNMQSSRDAMIMANALKNLPAPIVGVREITAIQKRVQVKENVTRQ